MRLGQLAKEIEVKPKAIHDFIFKQVEEKPELNLNLKVEESLIPDIKKHFGIEVTENQQTIAEEQPLPEVKPEESKAESNLQEENLQAEEHEGFTKEENTPIEITGEVPEEIKQKAPLVERPKIKLEGPKIISKIDLPEKPKAEPKNESTNDGETSSEGAQEQKPTRRKNIKNKRITLSEEERFAKYEQRKAEQKKREQKALERKKKRAEQKAIEKRKAHYLSKVQTAQPKTPPHKKKKSKEKPPVSPMMVSEIEKREREKRAHNKSWLGRLFYKIFG